MNTYVFVGLCIGVVGLAISVAAVLIASAARRRYALVAHAGPFSASVAGKLATALFGIGAILILIGIAIGMAWYWIRPIDKSDYRRLTAVVKDLGYPHLRADLSDDFFSLTIPASMMSEREQARWTRDAQAACDARSRGWKVVGIERVTHESDYKVMSSAVVLMLVQKSPGSAVETNNIQLVNDSITEEQTHEWLRSTEERLRKLPRNTNDAGTATQPPSFSSLTEVDPVPGKYAPGERERPSR